VSQPMKAFAAVTIESNPPKKEKAAHKRRFF
jgi:hypothetical protein